MQTFLPYPDFAESAACLDTLRLGKQRVEAVQIRKALTGLSKGWVNHPATRMWRGYVGALDLYTAIMILEWKKRGYMNTLPYIEPSRARPEFPPWLGDEAFHRSHKSNLLRKHPKHYSKFGWDVPPNLPYIWPVPKD